MAAALFLLSLASNAQTITKTGTTAAKFLSLGIGPRADAMGGAYTAVADDPYALYWNPAGIASIDQFEALFTFTNLFAGINLDYFGLVIPSGEAGDFALNFTAVNYGSIGVTTEEQPDGTGETFTPASYEFGITYCQKYHAGFCRRRYREINHGKYL